MNFHLSVCFVLVLDLCLHPFMCPSAAASDFENESAATWNTIGQEEVKKAEESSQLLRHQAKNVIVFLGDGMGVSTVTAARILKGGESSSLSFERFPHTALSKTYCADHMVTDSAAGSTAFQCGVKIRKGLLGLDPRVAKGDCPTSLQSEMVLTSILDWSLAAGKSVGLVTTTRITSATPGGAYANIADRAWEGDSKQPDTAIQGGCRDIARQLIEDYPNAQVLMGGGRKFFLPMNGTNPEDGRPNRSSGRRDFRNLIQEWLDGQRAKGRKASYVWNAQQFRQLDLQNTDYLLGLFHQSHMDFESERNATEQPSLAEMTETAIKILSKNPKGFYLLVEGGKIDHGHHANRAYYALHETLAFAEAVEASTNLTSVQETLTIITADHSHSLVIAGYQTRGSPILNVANDKEDKNGKKYTTLLYGNGPGYRYQLNRTSVTNQESNDPDYRQESAIPLKSATHAGEDVAIYAQGPMSHLFHGVREQNFIAHAMAYASCVGQYRLKGTCPPPRPLSSSGQRGGF